MAPSVGIITKHNDPCRPHMQMGEGYTSVYTIPPCIWKQAPAWKWKFVHFKSSPTTSGGNSRSDLLSSPTKTQLRHALCDTL